mmetsp:Transcript_93518/g.264481  ORF Transcript_93518/g.264481 Transcript_93518/m.264481 type:complete len:247 (+) Transcript_93518:404-1144(+)
MLNVCTVSVSTSQHVTPSVEELPVTAATTDASSAPPSLAFPAATCGLTLHLTCWMVTFEESQAAVSRRAVPKVDRSSGGTLKSATLVPWRPMLSVLSLATVRLMPLLEISVEPPSLIKTAMASAVRSTLASTALARAVTLEDVPLEPYSPSSDDNNVSPFSSMATAVVSSRPSPDSAAVRATVAISSAASTATSTSRGTAPDPLPAMAEARTWVKALVMPAEASLVLSVATSCSDAISPLVSEVFV